MREQMTILFVWNVLVMIIYGLDKIKAKRGSRRISEKTLLSGAFLFGGLGAIFGMILFNHKTSKLKFRLLVPLCVIVNAALIYIINII